MMTTRFASCFLFFLIISSCAVGQVQDPSTQMGSAPYATFQSGDIDNVNLDNGNVFLKIPLVGFPQRGDKLSLNFFVRYNAPRWNIIGIDDGYDEGGGIVGQWEIYDFNGGAQPVGVDVVRDQFLSAREFVVPFTCTMFYECGRSIPPGAVVEPQDLVTDVSLYQVRTPDGGMHSYAMEGQGAVVQTITPDGSHITNLQADPGASPMFLDGNGVLYSSVSALVNPYPGNPAATINAGGFNVSDPSGNQITVGANGWTDSIGRQIPGSFVGPGLTSSSTYGDATNGLVSPEDDPMPGVPSSDYSRCNGATTAARQWDVPSVNGTTQQYTFCYEDVNYQTAFNVSASGHNLCCYPPGTVNYAEASGSIRLLYEIVLPDNTNYQFLYDTYIDLTKITLPTGGSISYTWDSKAINPTLTNPLQRVVTSRTVVPGASSPPSSTGVWQYQWLISQYIYGSTPEDEYATKSIVTDPNGNDTAHAIMPTASASGLTFVDTSYSGSSPDNPSKTGLSGGVLKTVTQTRQGIQSPFYTDSITEIIQGPVTNVTTSYPDGHSTATTSTYVPAQSLTNYDWRSYGEQDNPQFQTFDCLCVNYNIASSVSTYAYGASSPGSLINTTNTTYQWQNDAAYLTANLLTLPASIVTTDGQNRIAETDYYYDESPSPSGARGNPTTISRWLDVPNSFISTKSTFSSYGMPTDMYDANYVVSVSTGNHVHTTYDSNGMYPTSVSQSTTNGIAHVNYFSYDFNTGLILSHTDQNGSNSGDTAHTTIFQYVDPLNRLTKVIYPTMAAGTPEVDFSYNSSTNTVMKKQAQGSGITLNSSYQYDGLGRTIETNDTAGATVDIVYNSIGQVSSRSDPYFGTSTGQTTFLYDPLGRLTRQTDQDGSKEWFCYNNQPDPVASQPNCHSNYSSQIGEWADVIDENNNLKQQVRDSLGHLVAVSEFPSGPSGARLETDYSYSRLNNLIGVIQDGLGTETPRKRTFMYDSLSRLTSSSNPETGTVGYKYDFNSNLHTRTDNRNVVTTYGYDQLNRLISRTYSVATPASCYQYDQSTYGLAGGNFVGRLTNSWTQTSTTCPASPPATGMLSRRSMLAYDAMGRLTNDQQCTLASCGATVYSPTYSYDLAGNVINRSSGIPGGAGNLLFTNSYDSSGHLTNVSSSTFPTNLFTATQSSSTSLGCNSSSSTMPAYSPSGALQNATFGLGLQLTRSYDSRLRLNCETDLGNSATNPTPASARIVINGTDQPH